jgi:hypothetical protein
MAELVIRPFGEAVLYLTWPSTSCHAIIRDAFITSEADARVPGGDRRMSVSTSVSGSSRRSLGAARGQGLLRPWLPFAGRDVRPPPRVTIATGNERAIRVWSARGFAETQRFESLETLCGSNEFVVLEG